MSAVFIVAGLGAVFCALVPWRLALVLLAVCVLEHFVL